MRASRPTTGYAIAAGIALACCLAPLLHGCGGTPTDGQPTQAEAEADAGDTGDAGSGGSSLAPLTPDGQRTTTETILDDHTGIKSDLGRDMIPQVPQVPDGRTVDEVTDVVLNAVTKAAGTDTVDSVELLSSQMIDLPDGPSQGMRAAYLAHLRDADDIGIEVTCSAFAWPVAKVKDQLRINDSQVYDVKTKRYVLSEAEEGQGDTEDASDRQGDPTAPANELNPEDPFTYYDDDGTLRPLTESSGPHNDIVEVTDSQGNPAWIKMGDLA